MELKHQILQIMELNNKESSVAEIAHRLNRSQDEVIQRIHDIDDLRLTSIEKILREGN